MPPPTSHSIPTGPSQPSTAGGAGPPLGTRTTSGAAVVQAARRQGKLPAPLEPFTIPHPDLPESLDGLSVLHISDVHARRPHVNDARWNRTLAALSQTPVDLVCLTGDYVDSQGQEAGAIPCVRQLLEACRARLGAFAIFGNHDTPDMRRRCEALDHPGVRWLKTAVTESLIAPDGAPLPLRIVGLSWPEDPVAMIAGLSDPDAASLRTAGLFADGAFPLTLVHMPTALLPCAQFNLPLLLAGHTHGGQIRLHARLAPHTSSDIPPHLATGCLRFGRTLCCVSRGLGEAWVPGLRINCPRQIPVYTLRRAPLPPEPPGGSPETVNQVITW